MCGHDLEMKEARVAGLLEEYPTARDAGRGHSALRGVGEVGWVGSSCPGSTPALLECLPDTAAGVEAVRVLAKVLLDDLFTLNKAAPLLLGFVLGLADELHAATRRELVEWLVVVAGLAEPVRDGLDPRILGGEAGEDRPEWARCRGVLIEHADVLRELVRTAGGVDADSLAVLLAPAPPVTFQGAVT
ncbi:hypothetical protein [Actinomadura sp. 21ATH]|uniref:hypothetical protein n=1 Tax=Actinomadura sp. 21ATH TaxID=1735444 RepID=UPI0035C1DAE0